MPAALGRGDLGGPGADPPPVAIIPGHGLDCLQDQALGERQALRVVGAVAEEHAADAPLVDAMISTPRASCGTVARAAGLLGNGRRTALLLGAHSLREECLELAGRIAEKTGAGLLAETFPSRLAR